MSSATSVVTSEQRNLNHSGDPASAKSIKSTNIPIGEGHENNADYHLPYYPRQVVNITTGWAQYLNPVISGSTTTTFDILLQEWIFDCSPRVSAERI